ncbi:MAG: DUF4178 domain-containing protein [Myxococcota bacterium]
MRALECPNCGAVHAPSNPGIVVIVCDRCDSTLYLEDDVLRKGERSVVGEPRSDVVVGASGRVDGTGVEVIGRVRLSHRRGSWDEWYVRTADGSERWLVEDEKDYALEEPLDAVPQGAHAGLELGDPVYVDGTRFEVREVGDARIEGGEGQLPRRIQPGETVRYADLLEIGGWRVLNLEISADGEVEAFLGRAVDPSAVVFPKSARRAPDRGVTASTIACEGCGAPFTLPRQGDPARVAACPSCDAVLELEGAAGHVLDYNTTREPFQLEVGSKGVLLGETWEVVGRMKYVDDEGYATHEYLCWAEGAGYLWLEYDNGHYSWSRPLEQGIPAAALRSAGRGTRVTLGGVDYFLQGRGYSRLEYVDGALPWEARRGDEMKTWDLANAPDLLSVEEGPDELEVFRGAWIPPAEMAAAFGIRIPRAHAVHFAQPNPWAGWRAAAFAALLVAALNLVVAGMATVYPGHDVVSFTIPASTTGSAEVESNPFVLDPSGGPIIGVRYDTQTDNSWVYIDLELADAVEDEAVGYLGHEVEYYHGYDDGAWTEGSQTKTAWMRTPTKGTYTLSGTLEYDRPTDVRVTVVQGQILSRYNLALAVPFGLLGVLLLFLFFRFEHQRAEDA